MATTLQHKALRYALQYRSTTWYLVKSEDDLSTYHFRRQPFAIIIYLSTMMKIMMILHLSLVLLAICLGSTEAFTVHSNTLLSRSTPTTCIHMQRRDVLLLGGILFAPSVANAKAASTYFFEDNLVQEPAQQYTGGKLDVNAAFVVSILLSVAGMQAILLF